MEIWEQVRGCARSLASFLKWLLFACLVGVVVGCVAVVFHHGIEIAAELRAEHPQIIWFLPVGGAAVALLYRLSGMLNDKGTNLVLKAVRETEQLKFRTAPLIFIATIITHLVGGSAGREGAALQLGGSMAAFMGRKLHLDEKDGRVLVMCGMTAAFTGLFGTPLAAAVFSMEVVSVGVMYYTAIIPCLVSGLTAFLVAQHFGLHAAVGYDVGVIPALTPVTALQALVLGAVCAAVAILFCVSMHKAPHIYQKYFKNPELRAAVGGLILLGMTLLIGCQDYNGAGDGMIRRMLAGETVPEAFLLKILFTAVTLGAGFRGGEIVPTLFTGCAVGTTIGSLLGLPHGFAGALGMAALFCGATNAPLSAIFLAYELFGGQALPLYALCCGVSYMLSGYYSLYSEQKIVYSKFRLEWIDRKAK